MSTFFKQQPQNNLLAKVNAVFNELSEIVRDDYYADDKNLFHNALRDNKQPRSEVIQPAPSFRV